MDALLKSLREAPPAEREAILRADLKARLAAMPSLDGRFKTFLGETLRTEGTLTASGADEFCAAGQRFNPYANDVSHVEPFIVYKLGAAQRGYWIASSSVAVEEFCEDPKGEQATAMWVSDLAPWTFHSCAYGDGARTIEEILVEFARCPRRVELEEGARAPRVVVSIFHTKEWGTDVPFKRIFLAPEFGLTVDRIEGRWPDGRASREMSVVRRMQIRDGPAASWVPLEWREIDFRSPDLAQRTVFENVQRSPTRLDVKGGDITTMCGSLPVGTPVLRRFADRSSVLYSPDKSGALVPQRVEQAPLSNSDELFLDTGYRWSWRHELRIVAAALAGFGLLAITVRAIQRRRAAPGSQPSS
jgi:hypothetical protein